MSERITDERLAELIMYHETRRGETAAIKQISDYHGDEVAALRELASLREQTRFVRITGLDKANRGLDEIVASGADIHVERMSGTGFYMSVSAGGTTVRFWLGSKSHINVTHEADGPLPGGDA